jgi:serine phosphatase RsbU (regulator of sigma subunit)/uncharacterized glyoxalase superfamily protein PhnB
LPDQSESETTTKWLTDKVVSSSGDGTALNRDRFVARLASTDPHLRLHFISVYVRNQEQSLRFYVEQLGFKLVIDVRFASGNRWVEVAPPDGTASLGLIPAPPGSKEEHLIGNSNLITFLAEDVDAIYREWSRRGVSFSIPPQRPDWGGTFCRFEDIDGNSFALTGFDEATRDIEERRKGFAAYLEAERRAAQEIEIAKQVQARLFPQRFPTVPGLDYAGVCIQARSVGGDYYDFINVGEGRIALVVGDIAGKGIAAALLMASLQASLRSQCINATDCPERFLGSVNRQLFENSAETSYATLFYADYDPSNARLQYANCGHLAALLLRANGSLERLESTCTVMGMFDDWVCVLGETTLDEGDVLALYTDGVTESFNTSEEEFGEERLVQALRTHCKLPACQQAQAIIDEVQKFCACDQFDDITLIIAKKDGGHC